MAIGRRDLLGLGAAVAIAAATSSCRDTGSTVSTAPPSLVPTATPPTSVVGPPSVPGQPPPGHLYYGASVPHYRSLPAWEREIGSTLALNRSYFRADTDRTEELVGRCQADLARGRLPHVSIKPAATWAEVASGADDAWLGDLLRRLGAEGAPLFLTLSHEPENDSGAPGMQPTDFVAMQRHAIALALEVAPLVTVVPVLQRWTFDPLRDDIDPADWVVEEAAVFGLDVYNPWSPTNGKDWSSFGSKIDELAPWIGGKPVVIGEYGCRIDPQNPGLAGEWMREAAEYARTHHIISMSYFNSAIGSPEGSWELSGETETTFAELLASSWVARPS
jgi:hypothetical protein